jgi:hypothetical protein
VIRNLPRRIQRLEALVVATTPGTIEIRVLLVHPEKGLTGVLVFGADNSTAKVPPTAEEIERVRADLEQRRAGSSALEGRPH